MTFEEWLTHGIMNKWCSPPVCGTHDVAPMTPEEEADFDMGLDPCFTIVRLFADAEECDEAKSNNELAWINYILPSDPRS